MFTFRSILMKKQSFWWWCVGVVLLEVLARWITPYNQILVAADTPRKAVVNFGWPEYTQHKAEKNQELIVIISNSQGESRELLASETYTAHLQNMAKEKAPHLRFENWSVGGIKAVDIEILTRKAILNGASKVFVIASNYAFYQDSTATPKITNNDVDLLAAPLSQSKYYENTLFASFDSFEEKLGRKVRYYSQFARLKTPFQNWLKQQTQSKYQIFLFGKYIDRKPANYEALIDQQPFFIDDPKVIENTDLQADIFVEVFSRLAEDIEKYNWATQVEFIYLPRPYLEEIYSKPLQKTIDRRPFLKAEKQFFTTVGTRFHTNNVRLHNWNDTVPAQYFGQVASFHFNRAGHRYFADLLFKHVTQ